MQQGIAEASEQLVDGLANGAHFISARNFDFAGQVLVVHGKAYSIQQSTDLQIDRADDNQHQDQDDQNRAGGNDGSHHQVSTGIGDACRGEAHESGEHFLSGLIEDTDSLGCGGKPVRCVQCIHARWTAEQGFTTLRQGLARDTQVLFFQGFTCFVIRRQHGHGFIQVGLLMAAKTCNSSHGRQIEVTAANHRRAGSPLATGHLCDVGEGIVAVNLASNFWIRRAPDDKANPVD